MKLDIKKIFSGSLIFIGVGVLLVFLSMILRLITQILADSADSSGDIAQIAPLIPGAYEVILVPIFLVIYFAAGIRAVKKHGLDAVGAGAVAGVSYFVTGIVQIVLETSLKLLAVSGLIPGGAGFGSDAVSAFVLGESTGALGAVTPAACGFGLLIMGTLINFVIGGCGGLFAQR